MMDAKTSVSRPEVSLVMASGPFVAILLAIVVPLLLDFGYGLFDVEVWFCVSAACCLAVLLGWIDRRSARSAAVILAVLSYAVVDLYFVQSEVLSWSVLAGFLFVSLAPVYTTFRIISVVFCLMFIATSMFSMQGSLFRTSEGSERSTHQSSASQAETKLPPIVHIVLDEFASLSRMPDVLPLRTLAKTIEADYLKRGFAIFPATRSTSGSSAISLSELVGPPGQRYRDEKELESKNKETIFQVPVNNYFDKLKQQGYRISVIQSSHLDFCGKQASYCRTYERAEFIDSAFRYSKPLSERLRAVSGALNARAFAVTGNRGVVLYRYVILGLDYIGVPGLTQWVGGDDKIWSTARLTLRVFDYLGAHFVAPKPGEAYFVHLLLPHFPYVLDRNCNLNPSDEWRWPLWAQAPARAHARSTLDDIYSAYGEQLLCTHGRVTGLIDAMMKSQMGSKIVFIVHGDHGARIHSKIDHLDNTNVDEAILTDGLDTFFAVKAPGLSPVSDDKQELLPVRFQEFIKRVFSR
jgi:hypothetical protein